MECILLVYPGATRRGARNPNNIFRHEITDVSRAGILRTLRGICLGHTYPQNTAGYDIEANRLANRLEELQPGRAYFEIFYLHGIEFNVFASRN